jgi:hypothetical protein
LKILLDGSGPDAPKRLPGIDEVTGEATGLYAELQQADAAPTAALVKATAQVVEEAKEALPGWDNFRKTQLPALDRKLRDAHHSPIDLARKPDNMPESGDED